METCPKLRTSYKMMMTLLPMRMTMAMMMTERRFSLFISQLQAP